MIQAIGMIFQWCGEKRGRLYLGFVYSFLRSLFTAVPIMLAAWGVELILLDRSGVQELGSGQIWLAAGAMTASVLLRFVFTYLRAVTQDSIGFEQTAKQRIKTGNILKGVSLGFFDRYSTGEIASAVSTDLAFIEMYGMHMVDVVVNGYISVGVMLLFLLFSNPLSAGIASAGILVSTFVLMRVSRRSMNNAGIHQKAQDNMVGATVEYLRGIPVAKAFKQEGAAVQGIRSAYRESRDINIKIEWDFVWPNALYLISLKAAGTGIIGYAAYAGLQGHITLPVMVMLMIFSFVIFSHIEGLGDAHHVLRVIAATFEKLAPIEQAEQLDENSKNKRPDSFDIRFEQVDFAYDRENVISDVTLSVPEGSTTAIVGPSGSGKTTLCRLLARFYDVGKGCICIGDIDIREMNSEKLLENISMVFQKVYLFHDSILNNIRFGRPEASEEEIVAIAKKARCHAFIMALPKGYHTMVGEGGATLSGGEKQRISIARAMLKDAPIIILDEATASVDPENEHLIQNAISELTKGKTVLVIAHRLATIQNADQIVVMDEGRIAQQGTHEELVGREGIYRNFVQIREKAEGWSIG